MRAAARTARRRLLILAIDTATAEAGVALVEGQEVRGAFSWRGSSNHSATLTAALRAVLAAAGSPLREVRAIAVSAGPGSYSGVRVGISEAKGIAMGLEVPLVGIASLDTLALGALPSVSPVWAALPAGRGRVYLARYQGSWESMHRTSEYLLTTAQEALQEIGTEAVTGEGAPVIAAEGVQSPLQPVLLPAPLRVRRPDILAELARRYFDQGGSDQRDVLEPLYLRRSAAEEKRAAETRE